MELTSFSEETRERISKALTKLELIIQRTRRGIFPDSRVQTEQLIQSIVALADLTFLAHNILGKAG